MDEFTVKANAQEEAVFFEAVEAVRASRTGTRKEIIVNLCQLAEELIILEASASSTRSDI